MASQGANVAAGVDEASREQMQQVPGQTNLAMDLSRHLSLEPSKY
jgi:hypothetical protein